MVTSTPTTTPAILNGDFSSGQLGWTWSALSNTQTNVVPYNTTYTNYNANAGKPVTVIFSGSQSASFSNGQATLSVSGSDNYGGYVFYGPRVISSPFYADAGDSISYSWSAVNQGDDYAIRAWLYNIDLGQWSEVNRSSGYDAPWRTDTAAVSVSGNYQFAFDGGGFDATYGTYVGATSYLDNVIFNDLVNGNVILNTAPSLASSALLLSVFGGTGSSTRIPTTSLGIVDAEQDASRLRIGVGIVPTNGLLFLDGNSNGSYDGSAELISGGDFFTQQDVNSGNVYYYYRSQGIADSFQFTVSDGAGGSVNNTLFSISLQPDQLPLLNTVSFSDRLLAIGESSTVTFSYSERISGFDQADINFGGVPVSLSNFATSDGGLTWTAQMVAQNGYELASNQFSVGTGVYDSASQSPASATLSPVFAIDTKVLTPTLALLSDTGSLANDLRTGNGTVSAGSLEAGATAYFRSRAAGSSSWSAWTQTSSAEYASGLVGTQEIEAYQVDAAGNTSSTTSLTFSKNDILFTYKLFEADGLTAASDLNVASWGSTHDKGRQYVLSLEAESLHGNSLTIDDLDLTLDFNNSLFEAIRAADIQITSQLPLANAALIDNANGLVRLAAGSADSLSHATGNGIGSKAEVARLLVNVKDNAFVGNNSYLASGVVPTDAGISISANLDETVFSDLTTLRDRGGSAAYQVVGPQIAVTRAEMHLAESAQQLVLGTHRTVGGNTFSNLIRQGDTVEGTVATWTNQGEAAATGVTLSLQTVDSNASLKLKVEGQVANQSGVVSASDIDISRGLNGVVNSREALSVALEVKAIGQAGSVIDLDEVGYTIRSNGGYSWNSSNITSTKNLITFQGDLNYDGRVSMLDLAYLNAGAQQVATGGGVARDVDANYDNFINLADLAVLDADWGKTLHTGEDSFVGSGNGTEKILIAELSQQGSISWADTSFADQNAIEALPDFIATLDAPVAPYAADPVVDGDGNPAPTSDITGSFLQDNLAPVVS